MADLQRKPRLLFFVTEDWVFCSHRLPLAKAALQSGFEVTVVAREREHGAIIRNAGIRLIPLEVVRRGMNPLSELVTVLKLISLYRREKPDIVHHVAVKPVLYGSIAARIAGIPRVVNALTGLGWIFISRHHAVAVLRQLVRQMLRLLLRKGRVIVQNPDDMALLDTLGVGRSRIRLIRGSGVDIVEFSPHPPRGSAPVVVLAARMLWDKGVGEFVEAARLLKQRGVSARFVLVGAPDMENPAGIPAATLQEWVRENVVEWWGYRADMADVYAQADIACLPSYREGLPKALLEAAACGLPIVTTDVPGCREVVADHDNGLLVPARNAGALADALQCLIGDAALCTRFGHRSRERAVAEFSIEKVVSETLALYQEMLQTVPMGK